MRNRFILLGILLAGCTAPKSVSPDLFIQNATLAPATGGLVLSIREERSIQTTFADIDHLQVDLAMPNATASQTMAKAALQAHSPSLSFVALPPGTASLLLTAFDAASNSIGSLEQSAVVEALKIKHVPLSLKLGDSGFYTASFFAGIGQGYVDSVDFSLIKFNTPNGVALSPTGDFINWTAAIYLADTDNHAIRRYDPNTGKVVTLAGGTQGNLNGTGTAARFNAPLGVALAADGNLFVADTGNNAIRKVTPAGVVTTLANVGSPRGIAVGASGNFYVSSGSTHQIFKVTSTGTVTAVAGNGAGFQDGADARFNNPTGIAVDSGENLYVADTGNHRIRKITPAGLVSTVAGCSAGCQDGLSARAKFQGPLGVAMDPDGNLLVSDTGNHRLRKIFSAGLVTTVAGGTQGMGNGCGSFARFNAPSGVAVNADGAITLIDRDNHRIMTLTK